MSRRRKVNRITNVAGNGNSSVPKRVSMDEIEKMPALLDTEQAASIIGATPLSIAKACADGEYPAAKCGREWRINKTRFLQAVGLKDGDEHQGGNDMPAQESMAFDSGNVFDFSSACLIKGSGGRHSTDETYISFTTNGHINGTNELSKTATLSLGPEDAEAIVERYGNCVDVLHMHDGDTLVIVITEGTSRAVSRSQRDGKGRRTISLGMIRKMLVEEYGVHRKVFMKIDKHDNCFVIRPTGKTRD